MSKNNYTIREIIQEDNLEIARVIRSILIEFGVPKVGTAYADTTLDDLYETYNSPKATYFVILDGTTILGGAGIAPLQNSKENICELQKMYFTAAARGKGLGKKMMRICLKKAKEFEYEKCYLETLPYMNDARKLYKRTGFKMLEERLGNTGHFSCNLWMLLDL